MALAALGKWCTAGPGSVRLMEFLYSGFEDIIAMGFFLGNNAEIGKGIKIHTEQSSLVHPVPPVSFQPSVLWE